MAVFVQKVQPTQEISNTDICMYTLISKNIFNYISDPFISNYSRLSLSRSRREPLKHFEISVLRFAELRKIPIEQANFTNEHII